jgi:tetratricopeptide (TPR) repeat protein
LEEAQFNIGLSLFYQKKYEAALDHFSRVVEKFGYTTTGIRSTLFMSRCHAGLNDIDSATKTLHTLIEKTDNEDYRNEIYYQLGWMYAESGDFQNAYVFFTKIPLTHPSRYPVESVVEAMNEYKTLSFRHPAFAGVFSIIPGGGYLYCNRYQDALVSFLVIGVCAAAACESFDADLPILGGMFTLAGIGFYGGSIYGGFSSAHKYNQSLSADFMNDLKNQFNIDLMTGLDADGVSFKIQRRF